LIAGASACLAITYTQKRAILVCGARSGGLREQEQHYESLHRPHVAMVMFAEMWGCCVLIYNLGNHKKQPHHTSKHGNSVRCCSGAKTLLPFPMVSSEDDNIWGVKKP
jgi:hypothetical protein